eukprot:s59_g28.t1
MRCAHCRCPGDEGLQRGASSASIASVDRAAKHRLGPAAVPGSEKGLTVAEEGSAQTLAIGGYTGHELCQAGKAVEEHLQALLERSQHEGSTLPSASSASMATRLATAHPLAPSVSPTQELSVEDGWGDILLVSITSARPPPTPSRPPPLTPERPAAGRPSAAAAPRWSDAAPQVLGTPEPPSPRRDRREEVKRKSREQKEAAEADGVLMVGNVDGGRLMELGR